MIDEHVIAEQVDDIINDIVHLCNLDIEVPKKNMRIKINNPEIISQIKDRAALVKLAVLKEREVMEADLKDEVAKLSKWGRFKAKWLYHWCFRGPIWDVGAEPWEYLYNSQLKNCERILNFRGTTLYLNERDCSNIWWDNLWEKTTKIP